MQTHADQSASILAGSVSSCAVRALSEEDGGLAVINLLLELWPCLASSEPQPTSAFTLAASTWQQLRSFAAAHGWQTLYAAFLRQQYSSWAAAVLAATEEASKQQATAAGASSPPPPAAAAESGRHSGGSSMQAAAATTLRQAPASTALAALTEHLATVQPLVYNSHSQSAASASLAPPSAQLALSLLAERFAAPGSPGMLQVLLQCLPPAAFHKAAPAAAASTGMMKAATPEGPESAAVTAVESIHGTPTAATAAARAELQGYHLQLSASEAADAAAVLASVPDRVQHLSGGLRDLQQPQYTCTVLLQALTGLQWVLETVKQQQGEERSESSGSNSHGSNSTNSSSSSRRKDGTPGECDVAVSFVVELVHRCIRRGQAAAVAAVLWRLTASDAPVLQMMPVHGVNGHPHAATPGAAAGRDVAAQAAAAGRGVGEDAAAAAAAGEASHSSAVQEVGTVPQPSGALLVASSPHGRSGVVVADSTLTLVLQGLNQHGASLERLLGQLLVLAGAPAASGTMVTNTTTTSSSSSNRSTMNAPSTEGFVTSSPNSSSSSSDSHPGVMERLTRLLHPLLTHRGAADYLVSERLLLQRTLPLAALSCLVRLLYSCAPVLLVKAGQRLADSWGDAHTIATTKVAQQAFMTAALVAVLQQLPGRCLDPAVASDASDAGDTMDTRGSTQQHLQVTLVAEAAGLVPAILSGVSTRLGNPLPALRRQGMRVGQALAAQLDPGKHTQLFGDQDLVLQPEEVWPGMSLQKLPPGLAAAAAAVEAAVGPSSHATGSSSEEDAAGGQPAGGSSKQGVAPNPPAGSSSSSSSTVSEGVSHPQQLGGQQAGPPVHGKDLTSGRDSALAKVLEEAEEPDSDDAEDGQPWSNVDQVSGAAAGPLSQSKLPPVAVPVGAWGGGGGADSDSGSDWGEDWGEDAAVEDPAAEEWWAADGLGLPEGKPLSLRALAAALRKQDDVNAVLDAVGRAEVLIRAAPDELAAHGPELARALLHCRVPEWADAEAPTPEAQPARQRARALTALLVGAPGPAGDQVLSEVYSQHLDQYQRLLILDSLSAAAQELADERSAPQLLAAPGAAPKLLPPAARATTSSRGLPATPAAAAGEGAANSQDGTSNPSSGGGTRAAPGLCQVTTRVWGPVSLAKQREPGHKTFKNRFGPFALRWATALLKDCDRPSPGIDLFGHRDALLLGRLLSVLGTFAAAAADTPAALPLAAGVLELLRAPAVHGHPQVFVRRNALAAAAQVLSHLPAPRVAAALLGHQRDAGDTLLQERLTWLQEWAAGVAAADSDEPCRMLAAGCCALQGQLAEEALRSMEQLPEALPGLGSGQRRGGGVQVQVPSLSGLRLG